MTSGRIRPSQAWASATLILVMCALAVGCDGGLSPPETQEPGYIAGVIRYTGTWPPADSLRDLRFVGMRFVPRDTADFLQLNRMAISDRLPTDVILDSFLVVDVEPGTFFYSGIAQHFSSDLLAWRPVGLYTDTGGIFSVEPSDTVHIEIEVDFGRLPLFPPEVP